MRVFVAGATGVIGSRLLPLLIADGHVVAGMTRSPDKAETLREQRAQPVIGDVFDADALVAAVVAVGPDAVMHELTDLPDDATQIGGFASANARIRREGTRNLLAAAAAASVQRFVAQSVAWTIPGDGGEAVADLERMVLDAGGVVVRYGQFYGPGTYHEKALPPPPRVHIDDAARRTLPTLAMVSGILTITDDSGG